MFSCEYVHEAPTNNRRNSPEKVKVADSLYIYSDEYYSEYSDEYYSDYDEYSSDPDFDYTDTLCYYPNISYRSSCSSGEYNPGVSPQPWKSQVGTGKSLAKQDSQNRSYPNPRKARKRHKKKRSKPSPPSTPVAVAERAQIKETQQLTDHPPTPLTMESVNTKRSASRHHFQH
jgi:hypothetical protein